MHKFAKTKYQNCRHRHVDRMVHRGPLLSRTGAEKKQGPTRKKQISLATFWEPGKQRFDRDTLRTDKNVLCQRAQNETHCTPPTKPLTFGCHVPKTTGVSSQQVKFRISLIMWIQSLGQTKIKYLDFAGWIKANIVWFLLLVGKKSPETHRERHSVSFEPTLDEKWGFSNEGV